MARVIQGSSILNVKNFVTGDGDAYGYVWVDEVGIPVLRHVSDLYDAADPLVPVSYLRALDPANKSSGDGRADVAQGHNGALSVRERGLVYVDFEQIPLDDVTPVGFDSAVYAAGARIATFSITGTDGTFVRMKPGGAPTTGEGVVLAVGGGWEWYSGPIDTTEFIAVSADAVMDVAYFQ